MADESVALPTHWDENVDYYDLPRVKTGISLTPRILSAMLVGGNAMGINWAAKFAKIPEMEVPDNAHKPVLAGEYANYGGDQLLSAILPPDIMGDLTETKSLDDVRDGSWIPEVLEVVTGRLIANEGEEVEHIYGACEELMHRADTVVFHWDANYVMHMLGLEHIDDGKFHTAARFYGRFADEDPAGSLFALFLLSFLGTEHFNDVIKTLNV